MAEQVNLVRALINCAEKAANIARVCRSNEQLLSLLVQEKTGTEANQRFEHDFKTLADVLIQETIKHEIGQLFPVMRNAILGEESPNFTNKLGQKITIAVGETLEETAHCLEGVLEEHKAAAEALATEVHREVHYDDANLGEIPELPIDLDYNKLGIWIDPIDATAEYISGDSIFTDFPGITSTGLDCVTVLIGVYQCDSGIPIIGVVAQPFGKKLEHNVYTTCLFWGVDLGTVRAHNCSSVSRPDGEACRKIGIFSSSENADVLQRFANLKYELAFSAGAGHKALKVITNDADVYLLSKGSTFRWDTCAPHAILRALGGDILDYAASVEMQVPVTLLYAMPAEIETKSHEDWRRNANGLIAIRNRDHIEELLDKLK